MPKAIVAHAATVCRQAECAARISMQGRSTVAPRGTIDLDLPRVVLRSFGITEHTIWRRPTGRAKLSKET
ncbi:hypothetical protein LMH87_009583 [Akanthomyces muscarius]|uniref:Uncharacterized protein n=1 Tax=Akanthomyces muscarius TaxID=2231603 RepID=A0A9W8QCA4_AKAMU|nr:hypothetical protein LMH87_009583 [Akanthomyces muscarius]KAJ4153077.1 hypothetical protein LMH87_009583 [Akanthomyces muscarius]